MSIEAVGMDAPAYAKGICEGISEYKELEMVQSMKCFPSNHEALDLISITHVIMQALSHMLPSHLSSQ